MQRKPAGRAWPLVLSVPLSWLLACGAPVEESPPRERERPAVAGDASRKPGDGAAAIQQRRFEGRAAEVASDPARRPNVLVLAIDNVRADRMSSYGNTRPTTPTLDALAARGVRFASCISQAPYTPHSFASLLTSSYVSDLPVRPRARTSRTVRRAGLEAYHVTLAEVLSDAGYATAAVVMGWFTEAFGLLQGFEDVSYSFERRSASEVVDDSLEWLNDWSDAGRERPFFLFSYHMDVHAEFMRDKSREQHLFGGDPDGFRYSREQMQGITSKEFEPTESDFQNAMTLYDEGLYWSDFEAERLLEGLQRLGLEEDTIVVFVSDHGEEFGEHGFLGHGQSYFGGVIDVPLIIVDPRLDGGHVVEERVMNVDVMPTILDLAGVPVPAAARGLSLAPSVRGETQPELSARPLFSEGATNGAIGAVIVEPYKLIVRRARARRLLFDLDADPDETKNLAMKLPDLALRLEEILFAHKRDGLATQLLQGLGIPVLLDDLGLPKTAVDGMRVWDGENGEVLSEEARKQLESLGYL